MFKYMLTLSLIFFFGIFTQAQKDEITPFSIGEIIEIESEILSENRTINVYLPESYSADSTQSYPIIYLLDGSKDEDFIHISGLVQFCSFSWVETIPESIVIGIANVDRKRDFTYPSSFILDQEEFPTSGGSEAFIKFIEQELQPAIIDRYRVTAETTLIGQSLGGLLATEILIQTPNMFDNYIIMSPSLWWDSELLLKKEILEEVKSKIIYIGVGKEGPLMERVAKELYTKILEIKGEEGLFFQYFENRNHGDALHQGVQDAFEKMFSSTDK